MTTLFEIQQIFTAASSARCLSHKSSFTITIHPHPLTFVIKKTALQFLRSEIKPRHFGVSMETLSETVSSDANDKNETDEKYRQDQRDIDCGVRAIGW